MANDGQDTSQYLIQLNGRIWGLVLGMLSGLGLLVATLFLVIKGGENVGQHLGLLGIYFPGYSVTFGGAFVGFMYAFFVGYAGGRIVCLLYNFAARKA